MTDTVAQLVQREELPSFIELFNIDISIATGVANNVYYFTPNVGVNETTITFNGQNYTPMPMAINGLEDNSEGAFPRPTLQISNLEMVVNNVSFRLGNLIFAYGDLIGCSVTYIRTFSIYLNTSISASPRKYYIGKKISHSMESISFELRNPLDRERAGLPKRQMLKRDFPGLGTNKTLG